MTLSNHFKRVWSGGPLVSTFILSDEDGSLVLETRDYRRMHRELRRLNMKPPVEMRNRLQQWTITINER